jgi:hypothetical protein
LSSLAFTSIRMLHSAAGIMFNNAQFQHISPSGKVMLGLETFSSFRAKVTTLGR